MAVILADTYEAFIDAGASQEKAKKASIEIAGFERMLHRLEIMATITVAGISILLGGMGYVINILLMQ